MEIIKFTNASEKSCPIDKTLCIKYTKNCLFFNDRKNYKLVNYVLYKFLIKNLMSINFCGKTF